MFELAIITECVRAATRERQFSAFSFFRCKRKHSRWVVNSYRQNTTTYNTKYLYILKGKASQSHRGPARLSVVPFCSSSSECRSLSICSAACIARLGINRILAWAEFPVSNFSRRTSRSTIARVYKSRRCYTYFEPCASNTGLLKNPRVHSEMGGEYY